MTMDARRPSTEDVSRRARPAFTLAELLVVLGVIALLISIVLPPLEMARRHAIATQCAVQQQHIGYALTNAFNEYDFYPLWDDGGRYFRYTWIDVLLQRRLLDNYRVGYCGEDARPDPINEARGWEYNVYYPGSSRRRAGSDYSYGIGVPLSAGGWSWQPGVTLLHPDDVETGRRRYFDNRLDDPSRRVMAGDASWSWIFNLSGDYLMHGVWNAPTQWDNTVAWRHADNSANFLKQDGHVQKVSFNVPLGERAVSTTHHFVWYSGEPLHVGPEHQINGNYYPDTPPPCYQTTPAGDVFPQDLAPGYYTEEDRWSWSVVNPKN